MGCVHSNEPLGHPPVVSISFARKSTKKRHWGSRNTQKKASKKETNIDVSGTTKEIPGLQPENQNIYQGKGSSNILRASLGSIEDLTVNHYSGHGKDIHRSNKFPGWGRYEKCTFCVTVGSIARDKATGGLGTAERDSAQRDPTQPGVSLVEAKEWLQDNGEQSLHPTALANLLALDCDVMSANGAIQDQGHSHESEVEVKARSAEVAGTKTIIIPRNHYFLQQMDASRPSG